MLKKNIRINIYLIFFSILLSLYILEAGLTLFGNYQKNQEINKKIQLYKVKTGKNYDTRKKIEVYHELKKKIKRVGVSFGHRKYFKKNNEILPLSGLSKAKTINCNESGFFSIYESDRYGFNNPDKEWDKKNIEYLLVGDSYGHGACVNESNTIAGNLRKLNQNKFGIINLSYEGNGPLTEYASLKEYMPELKVKNIIWLYFHNDLLNVNHEVENIILKRYLDEKNFIQNLKGKQKIIDELVLKQIDEEDGYVQNLKFNKIDKKINLIAFLKLNFLRFHLMPKKKTEEKKFVQFKKVMTEAKKYVDKQNVNLYFVYLPSFYEVSKKHNFQGNRKKILDIIKDLNINTIDMLPIINQIEDPLTIFPFKSNNHYNGIGYKLISEEIIKLK